MKLNNRKRYRRKSVMLRSGERIKAINRKRYKRTIMSRNERMLQV